MPLDTVPSLILIPTLPRSSSSSCTSFSGFWECSSLVSRHGPWTAQQAIKCLIIFILCMQVASGIPTLAHQHQMPRGSISIHLALVSDRGETNHSIKVLDAYLNRGLPLLVQLCLLPLTS